MKSIINSREHATQAKATTASSTATSNVGMQLVANEYIAKNVEL